MSHRCTWRTFFLGLQDWLTERRHQANAGIARTPPSVHPALGIGLAGLFMAFVLLSAISLLQVLDRNNSLAGLSTATFAQASSLGVPLALTLAGGCLIGRQIVRLRRFCRDMCRRGQAVMARQAG